MLKDTTMTPTERTRDIYEQIEGYPKPPLPPLPAPGDLSSLQRMGLKDTPAARRIVQSALNLSGFTRFQKTLPEKIETILRTSNLRLPGLYTPVLSATLALADDSRPLTPFQRAATLLLAARSLHEDLRAARLPPDRYGDQALEMGQYPNLFSTCLIVEKGRTRIFKSADFSTIAIAFQNQLYTLKLWNESTTVEVNDLAVALEILVDNARQRPADAADPQPGLLTTASDATQHHAFMLLAQNPINAASLTALRHTFLTLCLDLDEQPDSIAEAARLAHSQNSANRWWHASLQIVVFGNSKACAICNFSTYLDGNPMMRAGHEIQSRAATMPLPAQTNVAGAQNPLPAAVALEWQIPPVLQTRARQDFERVLDKQTTATFYFPGFGRRFFTEHQTEAVPAFLLALELATKRLTGQALGITQFMTMSRYRCMDLETGVVTTPAVERFVTYVDSPEMQRNEARRLLNEAVESINQSTREARKQISLTTVIGLYIRQLSGLRRITTLLTISLTFSLLRRFNLFNPQRTAVLVSHPEIYETVPVIGRPGIRMPNIMGFGLHYQVWDDRTVITLMPSVRWQVSNSELASTLQESLERVGWILAE